VYACGVYQIDRILAATLMMVIVANARVPLLQAVSSSGVDQVADSARERKLRRSHDRTAAEHDAVDAAERLLRTAIRYPIVLVDPELAPDPEAIRRVDAFIVTEEDGRLRQKIYVNRESALVQRAADGDDLSVKLLAAVIVHEMAHLSGQKEPEARAAEQRFFSDLIAKGAISEADGLRYLVQLRQRSIEPTAEPAR
jgi:hypothetical protein